MPTAREQAQELMLPVQKGQAVYDEFSQDLKTQWTIAGQTMDFWNDHFRLHVPENLTPKTCQILSARLMELWQEASFYYASTQTKSQLMKKGTESNFLIKFTALVEEHKAKGGRLPSVDTLTALAKVDGDTAESAQIIAEVEMKFWKETLSRLDTCRKLIENATLSISTELKYMDTEKKLDNLERRNNGGSY